MYVILCASLSGQIISRGEISRRCKVNLKDVYDPSGLIWLYFVLVELICLISVAGLCDINEGSATSEDRCKSPTSGNMFLSVY